MKATRTIDDKHMWNYRGYTFADQRHIRELRMHAPWLANHKDGIFVEPAFSKEKAMQVIDRWILIELITPEKKEALSKLWFRYGNYGSRHTPGNHKFIQRFLDGPSDEREEYLVHGLTEDCIKAVDDILYPK